MPSDNLQNKLSDQDLQAMSNVMGGLLDKQSAAFSKDLENVKVELKGEIEKSKIELKDYMHEGFEAVMHGMDNLSDRFVEKEKFDKLLEWAREVGKKVGVNPNL